MEEAQAIIYEWLRSIGYTATQREVKKLADTFKHHGYCKPPDRPELREKAFDILERFRKLDEIDRTSYQAGINSECNLIDATNEILALIPDKPKK